MRVDGIVARERGNRAEERTRDDYFVYETGVVVITDNFSCLKNPPARCRPSFARILRLLASRWWWFSWRHGSDWHEHHQ